MRLSLAAALFLSPCFERASFAQTVRAPRTVPFAGIPAAAPTARSSMEASSFHPIFSPSFSGPGAFSAAPDHSAPALAPSGGAKLFAEALFAAKASAELAAAADDLGEERGLRSSRMTGAEFAVLLEDARLRLLESGMSKAPSPTALEAAGIVMEQLIRVVRTLAAPERPLNESVRRVLSVWQVFNQEMEAAARKGTLAAVVEDARLFARQVEESVEEASQAPTAAAPAVHPVPPAKTASRDSVSAMAARLLSVEGLDGAAMKAEAGAGFEGGSPVDAGAVRAEEGGENLRGGLQAAAPSATGGKAEEVPGSIFDWKPIESSPGHGFAPLDFLIRKLLVAKEEGFSQGFEFRGAAQRSDAVVFFYGERHSDKELIAENMRRLAADMKPGGRALILVEGHLGRPMTGSEAVSYLRERGFDPAVLREKGISPVAVEVRGWDKAEHYERSRTPLLQHQVNLFELNELTHGPDRGLGHYIRFARAAWKTLGNWAELWRLAVAARNGDLDSAVAEAPAAPAAKGATLHVIAGSSHLVRRPLLAELELSGSGGFRKALKDALGGRPYWASAPPHTVEPPHLLVRRAESPRELARLARRFATGLRRAPDADAARAYVNGLWELAEAPPSRKAHAAAARALMRELKEGRADERRLLALRAVKALAGRTPFESVERSLVKAALALSERSPRRAVSREAAFVAESVAVLSPFVSVRRLALRHYRDVLDWSGDDSRVADAERAAARLAEPLPKDYWPAWKPNLTL